MRTAIFNTRLSVELLNLMRTIKPKELSWDEFFRLLIYVTVPDERVTSFFTSNDYQSVANNVGIRMLHYKTISMNVSKALSIEDTNNDNAVRQSTATKYSDNVTRQSIATQSNDSLVGTQSKNNNDDVKLITQHSDINKDAEVLRAIPDTSIEL